MAAPILPKELQEELDDIARRYAICIHTQQYPEALNIVTDLYDKMLAWQQKYGQRFHKGYPIHNIGYTLYLQNKPQEALKYFVLAYIEDLLSADNEDEADALPAGQALRLGYKYSPKLLELLKRTVTELKENGRIPFRPEEVAQELEKLKTGYTDLKAKITIKSRKSSLRRFTIFRSPWEIRVFVGGSVGLGFIIKHIAKIVKKLGYDPIVCTEFEDPKEMEKDVRRKCLVLLHNCKYAVFDIAEQAGQLMELERAIDYGIETLVIWPKNKEKEISEMIKSLERQQQIKTASYIKLPEDVRTIVRDFLKT